MKTNVFSIVGTLKETPEHLFCPIHVEIQVILTSLHTFFSSTSVNDHYLWKSWKCGGFQMLLYLNIKIIYGFLPCNLKTIFISGEENKEGGVSPVFKCKKIKN